MPDMDRWPTGRLLSTAARLVELAWNEKLRAIGLTHAGVIAMEVLATRGPVTQVVLAQTVQVQAQTMGKTLNRLEIHGHIVRRRSATDRRSLVVSLTDSGAVALAQASGLELDVLGPVPVDTDRFRQELKSVVLDLARRHDPAVTQEIVTGEPSL